MVGLKDTGRLAVGQWEIQPGRARPGSHLCRGGLDSWQVRRSLSNLQFSSVRRMLCRSSDTRPLRRILPVSINTSAVWGTAFALTWPRTHNWEWKLKVLVCPTSHIQRTRQALLPQLPQLTEYFQRILFNSTGALNGCSSRCWRVRNTQLGLSHKRQSSGWGAL